MNWFVEVIVTTIAFCIASLIMLLFRIYKATKQLNEQRKKTQQHINKILKK